MLTSDRWDVDKLYKELHDPSKERIDVECDACTLVVDAVQSLVRENKSEEEIVKMLTFLCEKLKIQDKLVCSGIVPEFRVS